MYELRQTRFEHIYWQENKKSSQIELNIHSEMSFRPLLLVSYFQRRAHPIKTMPYKFRAIVMIIFNLCERWLLQIPLVEKFMGRDKKFS